MSWPSGSTSDLEFQEDIQGKTVFLNFRSGKKKVLTYFAVIFALVIISLLSSPPVTKNGYEAIGLIFLALSFGYYASYYPLFLEISRQTDGTVVSTKRDVFFIKKTFIFTAEQNPRFVARKRWTLGGITLLGEPVYKLLVRCSSGGQDNDVNVSFPFEYRPRGPWPRGGIFRQQALDLAAYLGLPLIIEE